MGQSNDFKVTSQNCIVFSSTTNVSVILVEVLITAPKYAC